MPSVNNIEILNEDTTLFWFRRDLRVQDNAGLYHALKESDSVLPLFIFDTEILSQLDDKKDARVEFIYETLTALKSELERHGSSLMVLHGNPIKIFDSIHPKAVYTNHDYEPYAHDRDDKIKTILHRKGIVFKTFKDQVILEKDEVMKDDGKPYTVFTPYSKKWLSTLSPFFKKSYPSEACLKNLKQTKSITIPTLSDIGFQPSNISFPQSIINKSVIQKYDKTRDIPSINGTSRLSIHLRFGTLSIRQAIAEALKLNKTWLTELIWREFYMMILWHFPHVSEKSFKPAYERIPWRNNEKEFNAWCTGMTGYPIVDAGMRELNQTGFMHNRVRMITASFLVKHLLIDWRWGESYFAQKLLDYDLAANNGGWQWATSSGCDAAPYFRIFNPHLQTKKFDPDFKYIKKWVHEYGSDQYPSPIVDHAFARKRALFTYQLALKK